MIRAAILGATGMVGEGLLRILLGHPHAEIAYLGSQHAAGTPIDRVLPALGGQLDLVCREPDIEAVAREADVVFLAKKGPEALEWAPRLLEAGLKVIDCGGEFRFRDAQVYERFYRHQHTCPHLLDEAAYGLPELYRDEIAGARLVATPGCYPASVVLPLAPLLAEGVVSPAGIVVDSYSGLSGAGKQYSEGARNLFLDVNENCRAYSPFTHRHAPEMEQELSLAAGQAATVVFVPHLIPVDRGILTTAFADLAEGGSAEKAHALWHRRYAAEPFLRVRQRLDDVALADVRRSNYCDFAAAAEPRTGKLTIVSALDNVVKGACGLAVQSMNLMFGVPETAALLHRCI
ncbi:MAG: N-acetyl-gamma-glutamyl-phosphate reductase [Candidatus Brocadiia bacterium]